MAKDPVNDDSRQVSSKEIPFKNLAADYSMGSYPITTYFIDGANVSYIDVVSFLGDLDGFFDLDGIKYQYVADDNRLSLFSYYNGKQTAEARLRWDYDTIWVSDFGFFSYIVKSSQSVDYGSFLKTVGYDPPTRMRSASTSQGMALSSYTSTAGASCRSSSPTCFSARRTNTTYIKTAIAMLGVYGEIGPSREEYPEVYSSSLNGSPQSTEMRKAATNSLLFAFDYFYGLKEQKDIAYFKDYIGDRDLGLLLSTDLKDNRVGLNDIVFGKLDELHTRVDTVSMYSSDTNIWPYSESDYGDFW
jgi:hypothetical protein